MFEAKQLPSEILAMATLDGNEYAWPIDAIPAVIEAAKKAGLVNIGGQLQFRMPDGICECYWVQVDTYKLVPVDLPWPERVAKTAEVALDRYNQLQEKWDFLAEGYKVFEKNFLEYKQRGGTVEETMCFVWYFDERPR